MSTKTTTILILSTDDRCVKTVRTTSQDTAGCGAAWVKRLASEGAVKYRILSPFRG